MRQLLTAHRPPVKFEYDGEPLRLAPEVELTAYRVVQEALTNAARHAAANQATVRAELTEDALCLLIEDDDRASIWRPSNTQIAEPRAWPAQHARAVDSVGSEIEIYSEPLRDARHRASPCARFRYENNYRPTSRRHHLVREALRALLDEHEGIEVIGERNGNEAIELARTLKPDIVVMDISMPHLNGWKRRAHAEPQPPTLCDHPLAAQPARCVVKALLAGRGYLLGSIADELIEAIYAVSRDVHLQQLPRAEIGHVARRGDNIPADLLTPRERELSTCRRGQHQPA